MTKYIRCAVVALMLMPTLGTAQDFDAGLSAAQSGDYATALQEWRPLAELGDVGAQINLGIMYREGQGVPQDYGEAARWNRLAADQGLAGAQSNLGFMYGQGQGMPQDYGEAARWNRLAADQGEAIAQSNLGFMYRKGQGVPQDYVTAHMWFNIAAAGGAETAAENREATAQQMTPADISEAQRSARICMASGYQDCD